MMRKLSRRRFDADAVIRGLPHGDRWHHDIMAYLGSFNTPMALLAILRIYAILKASRVLSTGSLRGDIPIDVTALLVLGLANFSQAFMNFRLGMSGDRWIMGRGFDRITVFDTVFTVLDWMAAFEKIKLAK